MQVGILYQAMLLRSSQSRQDSIAWINAATTTPQLYRFSAKDIQGFSMINTMKPVYNDNLMGYFSAFWSSSRWSRAT